MQHELKGLIYAVAARFTKGLKNLTAAVTDWRELDVDTAVSEVMFQAHGWAKARRVVLIRRRKKEPDFIRGRELFDLPGYLFQAILTHRTDAPEEVWRFYRKQAEIETKMRSRLPSAWSALREDRPAGLSDAGHVARGCWPVERFLDAMAIGSSCGCH